jgi:shikimate kinase
MALQHKENVILIGMPAVGKSTIGVLLAKELSREFLDTDVLIQAQENRRLYQLIADLGRDAFCALEERYLLAIACSSHIIATGGSAVYSSKAMEHLAATGPVVYLHLPFQELKKRIGDTGARGVVISPGQSFEDLFVERRALYEHYANATVPCSGLDHEGVLAAVLAALREL